ncbi:hypothetical protein BGZ98_003481 [Dissophora globulifera]|nr:hypothetical protein BGZ98_003481 [Dissophora globulifera]
MGPGPSSLGPAGSEPRVSLLSRRNTETQRPAPLNLNGASNRGGLSSAAPNVPAMPNGVGKGGQYQDALDDLERHVYALNIESQELVVGDYGSPNPSSATSSTDLRVSPVPTRSNSNGMGRPGILRKPSQSSGTPPMQNGPIPPMPSYNNGNNNGYKNNNYSNSNYSNSNYGSSPPSRTGTPPVLAELRRMGSGNNSPKLGAGLRREDSVRSATSGGSGGGSNNNGIYQQPNGNNSGMMMGSEGTSYLDETVYAGLRDKLRVKCHYMDTRAVLVRADTPLHELIQRVQEKFQADRPLKLKYKDEDHHMLSMIDDEDWLMAQQVHLETTGSLDRMELWCFDDE